MLDGLAERNISNELQISIRTKQTRVIAMRYERKLLSILSTLPVLLILVCPNSTHAGDADEFNRLLNKLKAQNSAGDYHQAEQTGLKLKQLADGPLANHPIALALALNNLGSTY